MKLETRIVEKVWGRRRLPPPFPSPAGEGVGEIWFEPPSALPDILVKYLFTSEKLSVQVHPADNQAPDGCGKEECWLVLDAEPGASLAIGFRSPIDKDSLRTAALDGSIEDMLEWHPVAAGDFFYLPAGTVHAIGPGVTLVEVQQNADITYRLYDYGRPRELHLDEAIAVADLGRYAPDRHRKVDPGSSMVLVNGPYFRLSQWAGDGSHDLLESHGGPVLILPIDGFAQLAGERVGAGECALAEDIGAVNLTACRRGLIVSAP